MNHFTPYVPARLSLAEVLISDVNGRDLEERALETMRMRETIQRRAEAAMLLALGFTLAFTFALQVPA
ncbi:MULTISPECIES: hypothetical protein [Rhizobium]|uniref:hypothetical protein n=1 Tax=Rhizobium phaseoli TaxID=396 RepID=UPI0001902BD9|nr:hypothetical protein [Rhizobium phaseoli]ARM12094.1 hypothetical protein Bra5_CH01857 [Rhizobium phaseoli Brasil 5]